MNSEIITDKDRRKAWICLKCPICSHARKKQKGIAYRFVKHVEGGICPSCKSYEKVYGLKAHEPIPEEPEEKE